MQKPISLTTIPQNRPLSLAFGPVSPKKRASSFSLSLVFLFFLWQANYVLAIGEQRESYYIDFNYNGGENGSKQQPFSSFRPALKRARQGDIIFIKTGTYHINRDQRKKIQINKFYPQGHCSPDRPEEMLTISVDPDSDGTVFLKAEGDFGSKTFWQIKNSRCLHINGQSRLHVTGQTGTFSSTTALVQLSAYQQPIDNIVLEGLEVSSSLGRGISFRQQPGTVPGQLIIRNNRVHDIHYRAIGGYGRQVLIQNNEIYRTALSNQGQEFGSEGWPGVIQLSRYYEPEQDHYYFSRDIKVDRNKIHDCWGEGVIISSVFNGQVTHNTIFDVFSVGIYVGSANNILIDGNHLFRTSSTYDRKDKLRQVASGITWAAEPHPWGKQQTPQLIDNIKISNNLIDNLGRGISYWFDKRNTVYNNSYGKVDINHNILRNLHYTPFFVNQVPGNRQPPGPGSFQNNIIENNGVSASKTLQLASPQVWTVSHNNWTGGLPRFAIEAGSHSQPPGFIGPDSTPGALPKNFKLDFASPNRQKGTTTTTRHDFWRRPRPIPNPSIGLYE